MNQYMILKDQIDHIIGESKTELWLKLHQFLMDHYRLEMSWVEKIQDTEYDCRYQISGKTLCTVLLRKDRLICLLILGQKEREAFEEHRLEYPKQFLKFYDGIAVLHDGKWIDYELTDEDTLHIAESILLLKKKPNSKVAICGYCCDRCKAYRGNYEKKDERERISEAWHKYYGFYLTPEQCSCDGCLCKKKDAKVIDAGCKVKNCHLEHQVDHCYECKEFPCSNFMERKGLTIDEARQEQGDQFDELEYRELIEPFDNLTRNQRLREEMQKKK